MKDEFLGTVSHELRTPLTAVAGFAELLRSHRDLDDATRLQLLERIARNADEMRAMVERLLDYARLSAGRVEVEPRPLSLASEAETIVSAHAHDLTEHRVEVVVPAGLQVDADPDALAHVLGNLVSNAAKFSPVGTSITIEAAARDGTALVRVVDEGPGVAPDQAEALFGRFVQGAAPATTSSRRGAGLGLAIAKRYVELQGGQIWFEQPRERGASVAFTLPLAREP
jgi:signal transduction histidine kinase